MQFGLTKKLGSVLFGILVSVGITEGFLAYIDYRYTPLRIKTVETFDEWRFYHASEDQYFVYDPYLIWRPRNGFSPFNSKGYRGDEIETSKPKGTIRILALGDSNTLGWLGKGDHNWPKYLQETLRKHSNRFVVINAGVYGYSSFQGLRRLEEALSLQPDIVLVSFGWNDSVKVTMSDVDFARKKIRSLKLDRILLKLRIGQLLLAFSDSIFYRGEHHLVPRVSLAEYESNLSKMIQLAKNNNIEIILMTRPNQEDVPTPTPYDSVAIRVAKQTAVPLVDAYALFKGKHEYFYDENHFNEAGHRLMAKILYDRIEPLFVFSQ